MTPVNAPQELHIASLVVQAVRPHAKSVEATIAALPRARVHVVSPAGKLVVTLEASSADEMTSAVSGIQHLEGVLSAVLVYQCADTVDAMNETLT
jgi:nitrate reductase NapD